MPSTRSAHIDAAGRRGIALEGDLRDEAFAASIVDDTVTAFGGIDIVVLNAAYQKDRDGLASLSTEELDRVFKTNLYGLIFTARAAIPHLNAGASIIVTSSIQAFNPSPGLIDYAMTKAAQVAFVKALAEELGEKGIRVNAVAPGPIWTPAHSRDRLGQRALVDLRPGHAARSRRPARRTRGRVRVPRVGGRVVRLGRGDPGDGRQGPLASRPAAERVAQSRSAAPGRRLRR